MAYEDLVTEIQELSEALEKMGSKPHLKRTSTSPGTLTISMLAEAVCEQSELFIGDDVAVKIRQQLESAIKDVEDITIEEVKVVALKPLQKQVEVIKQLCKKIDVSQRELLDLVKENKNFRAMNKKTQALKALNQELLDELFIRVHEIIAKSLMLAHQKTVSLKKNNQERLFKMAHPKTQKAITALKVTGKIAGAAASAAGIPFVGKSFKAAAKMLKLWAKNKDEDEEYESLLTAE